MTKQGECVIDAMAGRVALEVAMAVEKKDNPSKALDHLDTAQKALDAMRYRIFQETHVSGTVG